MRTVLVAGAVFWVACVGCNAILGLNKFEVSGGPGGGGQGGTTACGSQFSANKKIVDSCVLANSCSPFVPTSSISTCISLDVQEALGGTACTATATSCSDVQLCEGYGFTNSSQCPAGQSGWRCDGNIAVNCDQKYFVSCDKRGGTCTMYDSNNDFVPDTAGCLVVDSCTEQDGTTSCQGDTLYTCVGGQGFGAVCTNLSAKCEGQGGQSSCLYAAPACSGQVAPCDGQTAEQCVNGKLLRYDCAAVGLTCDAEPGGPYCVAPGCKLADVKACHESCSGSVLHLCYGGASYKVDCKTYGFSRCRQLTDSTPGGIGSYVTCSD